MLPDSLQQLQKYFEKLPGIGPRQASRFVFHLLRRPKNEVHDISKQLAELADTVTLCEACYLPIASEKNVCDICGDTRRANTVCVVEKETDAIALEKSGAHKGTYFILGRNISPIDKDTKPKERLAALVKRVRDKAGPNEVILALNNTREGNFTSMYLQKFLKENVDNSITITRLGRGLATGNELEYVDEETLRNALEGRK